MKKKPGRSTCPVCGQRIDREGIQLLAIRGQDQEIVKAVDIRVPDGEWIPQVFVQTKEDHDENKFPIRRDLEQTTPLRTRHPAMPALPADLSEATRQRTKCQTEVPVLQKATRQSTGKVTL